jgi:NAD(P)-dependent dehydrogenase (short-subunit alcohol dehydrogenase family)
MPTVLVTGASRGIGREFVRQYADAGWRVIATCRDPAAAKLGGECLQLDVDDPASVARLGRALADETIEILINNAGISGPRSYTVGSISFDDWEAVLRTNVLGPIRVAEALLDPVARSSRKLMVFVSSFMGSIGGSSGGGSYLYRSSKAALNAAVKSLATDLRPRGIACALFHPGWVRTDMGGPGAAIDVDTSVMGMRRVIEEWSLDRTGAFVNYEGKSLPW